MRVWGAPVMVEVDENVELLDHVQVLLSSGGGHFRDRSSQVEDHLGTGPPVK